MIKKLILIDGSSLLSTSFFGNVPKSYYKTGDTSGIMKTSDGRFTNGVYTMSKVLLNVIEKQKPTHMAIAWDVSRNTFRRERYSEYKGQRKETKPELSSQFALMQEVIDSMGGIAQFKLEEFEADDIIGTFARKFEDEIPVYIMTKDQDALQLITEKTKVWLNTMKAKDMYNERGINPKDLNIPFGSFEFTPHTFEEEYGIKPIQMIDMKALEGDTSDNIPGVKGVGPKAVLPLLQEYGNIEGIYEAVENNDEKELKLFFKEELGITRSPIANLLKRPNSELAGKIEVLLKSEIDEKAKKEIVNTFKEVDGKAFKEKTKALSKVEAENFMDEAVNLFNELKEMKDEIVGKEAAFLSKDLATIRTNIEEYQGLALDDVRINIDKENMKRKFQELEFKSLIDKV